VHLKGFRSKPDCRNCFAALIHHNSPNKILKKRYHLQNNPLIIWKGKNLESKEYIKFTNLITDEHFRDLTVTLNKEKTNLWRNFATIQQTDIQKAREFIKRLKFKKQELLPHELDELFEKIISFETKDSGRLK